VTKIGHCTDIHRDNYKNRRPVPICTTTNREKESHVCGDRLYQTRKSSKTRVLKGLRKPQSVIGTLRHMVCAGHGRGVVLVLSMMGAVMQQTVSRHLHLRLRGGMGGAAQEVGRRSGVLGNLYPHYVLEWDGNAEGCRCLVGCRCAHCWNRNQGDKIDRNIVPSFFIDNIADAGDAPPDTLPSWPPPQGPGADVVLVQDPNSTVLEYAVFGAPDADELRWLRESGRLPAKEEDDAGEARAATGVQGHKEPEMTEDVSTCIRTSSGAWEWQGGRWQGRNASSVPETRRVVVGAGIWTWEHDEAKHKRIGNWYKIEWRRALHIEGHCRWERKVAAGGDREGASATVGGHTAGGRGEEGWGVRDAAMEEKEKGEEGSKTRKQTAAVRDERRPNSSGMCVYMYMVCIQIITHTHTHTQHTHTHTYTHTHTHAQMSRIASARVRCRMRKGAARLG